MLGRASEGNFYKLNELIFFIVHLDKRQSIINSHYRGVMLYLALHLTFFMVNKGVMLYYA